MALTSDFIVAINQIAGERGIDKEEIFKALEESILVAYKREIFGTRDDRKLGDEPGDEKLGDNYSVELNRETGTFKFIATKEVVDKVENENTQISISEAELISPNVEVGDSIQIEMPSADFGRISAQVAKQVVLQKIREAEKKSITDEYSDKVGEIFTALMQRMQKTDAIFEIGKATATMPQEEQVSNEFYRLGERYKVLLKEINDSEMIISRADPDFLVALFKLEVPEIESGALEVKAVAREAGSRSKMAVVSNQDGVDPIGSCVGQRGIRIANVMNELGDEKIDIIEWSENPEKFVENALSPAKIESVVIEGDKATVTVSDDQLSLAIGKEGQNVRLACKLTGYKIDILGDGTSSSKEGDAEEASDEKETEADNTVEEVKEEEKAEETREEEVKEEEKEEVKEEESTEDKE
ncbi:transcription termination/antitermination protein NusA [bacterium]|nr:transcription termination/antitermination protein NusA [bacterium]